MRIPNVNWFTLWWTINIEKCVFRGKPILWPISEEFGCDVMLSKVLQTQHKFSRHLVIKKPASFSERPVLSGNVNHGCNYHRSG